LRGRVPVHRDTAGLYPLGSSGGVEQMNLLLNSLPAHSHALNADGNPATTDSPSGAALASPARNGPEIYNPASPDTPMAAASVGTSGGSTPFSTIQPSICVNFCIATTGIFPSRN
jgi:microcystin-dependent protein